MSVDYAAHIAAEEAHIRRLAADPGWRGYAVDKASRMAREHPGMYASLPQIVADTPTNPSHQPTTGAADQCPSN
jgi:hypothetical protein